jgi:hypothetical protein
MKNDESSPNEYNQILSRFSVRRYLPEGLGTQRIAALESSFSPSKVLYLDNAFSIKIFKFDPKNRISGALGPFGRIFKAPYFLAPYTIGQKNPMIDLGYRTQQIVLNLWREGIGTCYIGCAHHPQRVKELLALPAEARIVSLVVFGIPAHDQSKYIYQKISQAIARSSKRLGYDELFLEKSAEKFDELPDDHKKIIEAGRQAPSATNAQPWRFKIENDHLVIIANRRLPGRIYDIHQDYTMHDTGICMANISRAGEALGKRIDWEMLIETNAYPERQLFTIARYKIT